MVDEPSGRNEDGTFAPGNTFSDGRNKYARQQELRQQFAEAITNDQIQELARKMMTMALSGDTTSAKILTGILFKEPSSPSIAVQVNNQGQSRAELTQRAMDVANRIRQQRQREALGFEANSVIGLPSKQEAGE